MVQEAILGKYLDLFWITHPTTYLIALSKRNSMNKTKKIIYYIWKLSFLALTSGAITEQGCSVLGIFLYILNHYPMTEPVSVMNIKIRSTLIMLKRVGIVENVGEGVFFKKNFTKKFREINWDFFPVKLKSWIFFYQCN